MVRHRSCVERPEGAPCQALDTQQWQECNLQACPECPPRQVLSTCATLCPSLCSHLQPGTICVQEPCQLGCSCPGGQRSLPWGLILSLEEQAREVPPGTVLTWNCTHCTCQGGAFICSLIDCQEEEPASCRYLTELRNLTKGPCHLDQVEVSYCSGYCRSSTNVMTEEPYLQSQCDCCSYHLDPDSPVRILHLHCPDGHTEPVVLPMIHSCQCSACQGIIIL
ncbi:hypothetical protein A6R68_17212 [Neotoma lepida]|uniref:CTCK domain-containing protein n=1 Tax=Neotoma lepida TaxID=56216 RepID=A0A1A6HEJ7_NEOLE|nr:hypothetical protein A6R68_17212 [Neotoma lepida]